MKHYLVYQITNLINGMIYIGKHETEDPNDSYMGSSKWLANSIKKHGIEHYKKEILFDFDNEAEMNDKERELVNAEFVARKDTYNLIEGGTGSWQQCNSKGMNNKEKQYLIVSEKCKHDPKYRENFGCKVSIGLKRYYEKNPGIRRGIRASMFGRTHSQMSREKMSKKHTGILNNRYGVHWYTNAFNGEVKSFMVEPSYPWVRGRNLFRGESERLNFLSSRLYNGYINARDLWDAYHGASYNSLGEWAREHKISYQAVTKRFKRFIPMFNMVCKPGIAFPSNRNLIGLYDISIMT